MTAYSLHDTLVLDVPSRLAQAAKIGRVLAHAAAVRGIVLAGATAIDVGCSSGIVTRALAPRFQSIIGVDVDWNALSGSHEEREASAVRTAEPAQPAGRGALGAGAAQTPPGGAENAGMGPTRPVCGGAPRADMARSLATSGDVSRAGTVLTPLDNRGAFEPGTVLERPAGRCQFAAASGLALPVADRTFDVAMCNQVYQYVPDVPALFAELRRVLRPGGLCYFSARNLWGVAAAENRLPFISAFAPVLARRLERSGASNWRQRAGTLWPYTKLRRLAETTFVVHDYTTSVLCDPQLADLFVPARYRRWLAAAPRPLLALLMLVLPTHLWVLERPTDS